MSDKAEKARVLAEALMDTFNLYARRGLEKELGEAITPEEDREMAVLMDAGSPDDISVVMRLSEIAATVGRRVISEDEIASTIKAFVNDEVMQIYADNEKTPAMSSLVKKAAAL